MNQYTVATILPVEHYGNGKPKMWAAFMDYGTEPGAGFRYHELPTRKQVRSMVRQEFPTADIWFERGDVFYRAEKRMVNPTQHQAVESLK